MTLRFADFPPASQIGDLIVEDGQAQLGDLLLGRGTNYTTEMIPIETPEVRGSEVERSQDDGMDVADDYYSGRYLIARIGICAIGDCGDGATPGQALDALGARLARIRSFVPFAWRRPHDSQTRFLLVRPRRFSSRPPQRWLYAGGVPPAPLELFAPDMRWYAPAIKSIGLALPTPATGWTFDWEFGWTFGGGTGGSTNAVSAGSMRSPTEVRLDGPLTNPRVRNLTHGEDIRLSISLAAGQFLIIDSSARTIMLNGTASRYNSLVGVPRWLHVHPGSNQFTLTASSFDAAAAATVRWRDAWNM